MASYYQIPLRNVFLRAFPGEGSQTGDLSFCILPQQPAEPTDRKLSDTVTLRENSLLSGQTVRSPDLGGGGMYPHFHAALAALFLNKENRPTNLPSLENLDRGIYVLPADNKPFSQQIVVTIDDDSVELHIQNLSGRPEISGHSAETGEWIVLPAEWTLRRSVSLCIQPRSRETPPALVQLFRAAVTDASGRNKSLDPRVYEPFEQTLQRPTESFERWGQDI